MIEIPGESQRGYGSPVWMLLNMIKQAPEKNVRVALMYLVGCLDQDAYEGLPPHTSPSDFLLDMTAQLIFEGVYIPTRCECEECDEFYANLSSEIKASVDEDLIAQFRNQLDSELETYNKEENND